MRWRNLRIDHDSADRLDAALDAHPALPIRTTKNPNEPVLDTARQIDRLDYHDVEPEPTTRFVQSLENTLMHHANRASRSQRRITGLDPLHPLPIFRDGTAPHRPMRLRTIAGHFLSWFSTAAILAIVACTVVLAYVVFPRANNDDPSRLAAVQDSTPAPEESSDEMTPVVAPCEVAPRDFGQVLGLLQWRSPAGNGDLTGAMPPTAPNRVAAFERGQTYLPDGGPVSREDMDAAAATFGEYWGCLSEQNTYGSLALLSDNEVVRKFYPGGIADNYAIASLNDPPQDPALIERYDAGDPTPFTLFDFRQYPDGRIAAFLGIPSHITYQGGANPVPETRAGYIVFVQGGDGWIIDEYFPTTG